ncbi:MULTISPECIES: hypothetical protein [Pseudomonas]|jgi:hypothetical protein|uniref:hypothetical protein n=1 Tax=Pseudomonas TaxID=286 RepID=UPI0011B64DF5|nr:MULTISPECIES: hypothetical protein [Pseudomonas]
MKDKQAHQGEVSTGKRHEQSTTAASEGEGKGTQTERATKAELYSRHDKGNGVDTNVKPAKS